ncbi:hypothetical protein B0H13DRAFT_1886099 [Mycena leptocephala]|nr:hypothetical protein B0H13DRAFT_1886099 [Mycena leptocephala]
MVILLYIETGIVPLRVRRFILALGYLQYLLDLHPTDFARATWNSSIKLNVIGTKSWAKDPMSAASKLPFACPGPDFANTTSKSILDYANTVDKLMLQWIQGEVNSSDKLYLSQKCRDPPKDKPLASQTPWFCKSEVETPQHVLLGYNTSPEVVCLRSTFLGSNLRNCTYPAPSHGSNLMLIEFFKSMVYEHSTIPLVAKFAHEVLEVFYANPVFRL